MKDFQVLFLEVKDGQDAASGTVVVIDYKKRKLVSRYSLERLPSNYYLQTGIDKNNNNIVHIGNVAIDYTNIQKPVAHTKPVSLNVTNANGDNKDRQIVEKFGNDLIMAVPTLHRQGLFVVRSKPHRQQALELYGMIGGLQYEYTIWELDDWDRFEKIIPMENSVVTFIITTRYGPEGYAKIVTYDYGKRKVISQKTTYDLYDPVTSYVLPDSPGIIKSDTADYAIQYLDNSVVNYITQTTNNNYTYIDNSYTDNSNSFSVSDYSNNNTIDYGQDAEYSTGSPSANGLYDSSEWTYTTDEYYDDTYSALDFGADSEYSTGSPSANGVQDNNVIDPETLAILKELFGDDFLDTPDTNYINQQEQTNEKLLNGIMKYGTWKGVGHQTWRVVEDYEIRLFISDNEYYFEYIGDDYRCDGALTVKNVTTNSITFLEHFNNGKGCKQNYFTLTKISDDHFSYESFLLNGEHAVSGDVYFSSSSF